jgi:hypothetical protein
LYNIFHILRTYFLAAHYDVYMYLEAGQALDHSYRSVNILLKWKLVREPPRPQLVLSERSLLLYTM